jgi:hypothetical protein
MSLLTNLFSHNLLFTSLTYIGVVYAGYWLYRFLTSTFKAMQPVTRVTIAVLVAAFLAFVSTSPLLTVASTGSFILGSHTLMLVLTVLQFSLICAGLIHVIHWIFKIKALIQGRAAKKIDAVAPPSAPGDKKNN